jgi:hypothetical protein
LDEQKDFCVTGVPDECWGKVKVMPEEQNLVIERAPGAFKWQRFGTVGIHERSSPIGEQEHPERRPQRRDEEPRVSHRRVPLWRPAGMK